MLGKTFTYPMSEAMDANKGSSTIFSLKERSRVCLHLHKHTLTVRKNRGKYLHNCKMPDDPENFNFHVQKE